MCGSFYVFYGENVISLFLCIAGNVIKRLAFSEQHFQDVALIEFR